MTIQDALSGSIGAGLSAAQIEKLAAICRREKFQPNDQIIVQQRNDGDPMIVLEGTVRVTHFGREIRRGKEGSLFGEIALIDNFPRSANVEAVDACEVAFLPAKLLDQLFEEDSAIAAAVYKNIAKAMCAKMRQSTNWAEGIMAK